MKLGKTEQRILDTIAYYGDRHHWRYSASYDRNSAGRREVTACQKLHDRGLVDIVSKEHYNIYLGAKQGTVSVFEMVVSLKPEWRLWAKLGGKL